jgi:hypothetical protein
MSSHPLSGSFLAATLWLTACSAVYGGEVPLTLKLSLATEPATLGNIRINVVLTNRQDKSVSIPDDFVANTSSYMTLRTPAKKEVRSKKERVKVGGSSFEIPPRSERRLVVDAESQFPLATNATLEEIFAFPGEYEVTFRVPAQGQEVFGRLAFTLTGVSAGSALAAGSNKASPFVAAFVRGDSEQLERLAEQNPLYRIKLLQSLDKLPSNVKQRLLNLYASDVDEVVRASAVYYLARQDTESSERAFDIAAKDTTPRVKVAWMQAVGSDMKQAKRAELMKWAESTDTSIEGVELKRLVGTLP